MKTIKVKFRVEGYLTHHIEILNGDTPEEFAQKLDSAEYLTSLSGDRIFESGSIEVNSPVGKVVGKVVDTDNETEFDDFELIK